MKKCSKCGIEKPMTAEYYHRHKRTISGFRDVCKACIAEWRKNNKEKILKRKAEYYQNNKEKIREKEAEYRKNNKEKILKRKAEYYQNNKEKIREYEAEYRKNNREKVLKQKAEYYQNNKEKILKQKAEYRHYKNSEQPACVYQIVNSVSNRIYIGETMRGEFRWKQHLCNLKGNRHPNCKLQEDYDKFGEEAFSWSIIQEYPKNKDVLLLEEIRTIDRFLREGKELYNLMLTIDQLKLLMDIGGDGCDINHRTITKEALAKAKTNGVKLGTHNEVVRMGREAQSKVTNDRLFPLITEARKQGLVSLQKVAAFLNDKGVKTPKGKIFTKANLSPIMKRYRKEILMEEK